VVQEVRCPFARPSDAMDASLGLPAGATVAVVVGLGAVLLAAVLGRTCSRPRGSAPPAKPAATRRGTAVVRNQIALVGPPGSGKTFLAYKLLRDAEPATVPGVEAGVIKGTLGPDGPAVTLVDTPGSVKQCVQRDRGGGGGAGPKTPPPPPSPIVASHAGSRWRRRARRASSWW
jgi:hypothetical protein